MAFSTLDYVVFGATLLGSASIGTYYRFFGGKQKTNEEYLLGNRSQNPITVAVSLMASFMSAISLLGGVSEAYFYGTHFFTVNIGYLLGILVSVTVFVPVFLRLESISVYEYLELRFGKATRICASLASTVQMVLYMSIVLVAPSIALQTVIGLSHYTCVIIVGLVCLFYSTVGGIKAIIVADLFQAVLMFCALFAIIFSALETVGGVSRVWELANEYGRIDYLNFSLDPTVRHSWLSTTLGGLINGIVLTGINQTQVQRYRTMKNYKTMVISSLFYGPMLLALSLSVCVAGLCVFAKYYDCDPLLSGKITKPDQLLAFYAIETFTGSGLSGIFVAGIFSASLSTISPLINSLAAVTVEDYGNPLLKKCARTGLGTEYSGRTQLFAIFYGLLCIVFSLLALNVQSVLQASLVVFNVVGGPMLGIFCLGIFMPLANEKGTLSGFAAGLLFTGWVSMGQPRPVPTKLPVSVSGCGGVNMTQRLNHTLVNVSRSIRISPDEYPYLFRISYFYYGVLGFVVTFVMGILLSLVFRSKTKKEVNGDLICNARMQLTDQKNGNGMYLEEVLK